MAVGTGARALLVATLVGSLLVPAGAHGAPSAATADSEVPVTPEEARVRTAALGGPSPRVVGGSEVSPPGKYPWIISVQTASHICGGVLVTASHVVSTAHCFTTSAGVQDVTAAELTIVVGRHDLSTGDGEEIAAAALAIHPLWDGEGSGGHFDWDIAVITLAAPASAGTPATLASAADAAHWDPGDFGTTMGWGDTDGFAPFAVVDKLQEVDVPFTSDADCDAAWPGAFFAGLQICAGDLVGGGVDSCVGDSGGPLVAPPGVGDWKLVGLVSSGPVPCGNPGEPGLYTFVPNLRSFIVAGSGGANAAPVADADTLATAQDVDLVIDIAADLLTGDGDDLDGALRADQVALATTTSEGTLTDNGDGTLTYSPGAGFTGDDAFSYTVADSAGAVSAPGIVTISVQGNVPPTAGDDGGPAFRTNEDTPFITGNVLANDDDPDGSLDPSSVVALTAGLDGVLLYNGDGTFHYFPPADFKGLATFGYQVADDDGAMSNVATVTMTVVAVNDPPSFTAGPGPVVLEDAGPQRLAGWASGVSPGPADEASQQLSFLMEANTNLGLFLVHPTIDPSGLLAFTPAADANGTAIIRVSLRDDGGTASGGVDRSASQEATITVLAVNDPPSFTAGPDVTVAQDAGPQVVTGWAGDMVVGPADESGQSFAFTVVGSGNPGLFAAAPTVDAAGTLRFTAAPGTSGSATIRLAMVDDGGTANGGRNTSAEAVFKITVLAGGQPPPGSTPAAPGSAPAALDGVGLVDPQAAQWALRRPDGVVATFLYGNPGDQPFTGDWDCDGTATAGLFRASDGFVYLRNANTIGIADIRFFFGNPGDVAVVGDFDGDGCDTVSLYRPDEQRFFIVNRLGANDGGLGAADFSFAFGDPGDRPFSGDMDGDGITEVGLHRLTTGLVYYRETLSAGVADHSFVWGNPDDVVFAGDWDGDGDDTVGLFRPALDAFFLRNSNSAGGHDLRIDLGRSGVPVAGRFSSS